MTDPYYQDDFVTLWHGDCLDVLPTLPDASVDSVVTDPPYELGFMGKGWDATGIAYNVTVWRECLRVLKPGGMIAAFGGTRTFHRLACAIEDAGFEIRDSIAWLYGSGFSKGGLMGNKAGLAWCDCGPNALPYNHAPNTDLPRVRQDVHPPAVARSEGQDAFLLAPVQRGSEGSGVGQARPQGAGGMDPRGGGVRGGEDARGTQPGMGGRFLPGAGQGLPHGAEAGSPEGQGERLRGRAPAGHGGDDRSPGHAAGGSAPHQPGPGGQPTGEPEALPGSHEPLDDGARRGRVGCPRCGGLDPAFRGFSTTLKPAFEPVVVARKPLVGTVAANVLAWGTGALNIAATRVPGAEPTERGNRRNSSADPDGLGGGTFGIRARSVDEKERHPGRWPANVVLDEHAAAELDRQSGDRPGAVSNGSKTTEGLAGTGTFKIHAREQQPGRADSGGASRFFYVAKAPTSERPRVGGIAHPTVKPLDLMRWLVRLVTPPGGTVLEPFAGSGTTAEACVLEGFQCIAIEREAEYLPLIVSRLDKPVQLGLNFEEPS